LIRIDLTGPKEAKRPVLVADAKAEDAKTADAKESPLQALAAAAHKVVLRSTLA
jgi:hypothetical protein